MTRPRLTAFCVFSLVFVVGSGFVWSQELMDAYSKFHHAYREEFYQSQVQTQEELEFMRLTHQLMVESGQTAIESMGKKVEERLNALGTNSTEEEKSQVSQEVRIEVLNDNAFALQRKIANIEKEMFPDAQKRQQREFQFRESIARRLESIDDPEDYSLMGYQPDSNLAQLDFLELTPEQIDLIKELQKETSLKTARIHSKSRTEQQEKMNELNQLGEKFNSTTQTDDIRVCTPIEFLTVYEMENA